MIMNGFISPTLARRAFADEAPTSATRTIGEATEADASLVVEEGDFASRVEDQTSRAIASSTLASFWESL